MIVGSNSEGSSAKEQHKRPRTEEDDKEEAAMVKRRVSDEAEDEIDFLDNGFANMQESHIIESGLDGSDDVQVVRELLQSAPTKPVLVHIIGLPGSGKTTVLRKAMERMECTQELAFRMQTTAGFKYSKSGCVAVLGSWSGHAMDGMDRTSLAGSHDVKHFVGVAVDLGVRLLLCEGYRLMQLPFLEAVKQSTIPVLLNLNMEFAEARRQYTEREVNRNAEVMPLSKYMKAARRLQKWSEAHGYECVSQDMAVDRICNHLAVKQEADEKEIPVKQEVKEEIAVKHGPFDSDQEIVVRQEADGIGPLEARLRLRWASTALERAFGSDADEAGFAVWDADGDASVLERFRNRRSVVDRLKEEAAAKDAAQKEATAKASAERAAVAKAAREKNRRIYQDLLQKSMSE